MTQPLGWSELVATNAPVADEPVEAVFHINENPILFAQIIFFFPPLLYLPPSYLPSTSPLLPTTYHPLPPSLHRQSSRDVERELEPGARELELGAGARELVGEAWSSSLEQKLGAWSRSWRGTHAGPR